MTDVCNIAASLAERAAAHPDKPAVIGLRGGESQLTFGELEDRAGRYAAGLARVGIGRGTRTVLMVPPGPEFFALVFALYRVGAVLVLIDPGIDKKALAKCLAEVEAEAFVGVPLAHVARLVFRKALGGVRVNVTVGRRWFWGGYRLRDLLDEAPRPVEQTKPEDVAAVLFTSGSTGVPKGAVYTHGIFAGQIEKLQHMFQFAPDEVDLSTFPLFALFMAALGATSVIPDMDPRKPAEADPAVLLRTIRERGCTSMFGSPALLDNLSRHCEREGAKLTGLRRAISAGAPVRHDILRRMRAALPEGAQVFTPYGATESLPVCHVGSDEILATSERTASGEGVCVGKPVDGMQVRVIRISDDPIATWSDDLCVPDGEVGEITVRGAVVTPAYFNRPDQTALAKINEGGQVVHRMGDLGAFDQDGRLWMCGRKAHRVETERGLLFSVRVEMVCNQHPEVWRTALVGVGARPGQRAVLLVKRTPGGTTAEAALLDDLKARAEAAGFVLDRVAIYPGSFPVDIRHNTKIQRERLAQWATDRGL